MEVYGNERGEVWRNLLKAKEQLLRYLYFGKDASELIVAVTKNKLKLVLFLKFVRRDDLFLWLEWELKSVACREVNGDEVNGYLRKRRFR